MSRDLSQNERRLAALAAIGVLWGAFLVAIGFSLPLRGRRRSAACSWPRPSACRAARSSPRSSHACAAQAGSCAVRPAPRRPASAGSTGAASARLSGAGPSTAQATGCERLAPGGRGRGSGGRPPSSHAGRSCGVSSPRSARPRRAGPQRGDAAERTGGGAALGGALRRSARAERAGARDLPPARATPTGRH